MAPVPTLLMRRRHQSRCHFAAAVAGTALVALCGLQTVPAAPSTSFIGLPDLTRRASFVAALPWLMPAASASAARGTSRGGSNGSPGQVTKVPESIEAEGSMEEKWDAIDIGASSLVDPNDPKYKQLRLLAEMEKQQKRNEEYDNMSKEEKAAKMCELLGRGCQGT